MRCDLPDLYKEVPPNDSQILANWRRELLGITEKPIEKKYDLVVVGGGYSVWVRRFQGPAWDAKSP